jgi:hypothetical protein
MVSVPAGGVTLPATLPEKRWWPLAWPVAFLSHYYELGGQKDDKLSIIVKRKISFVC